MLKRTNLVILVLWSNTCFSHFPRALFQTYQTVNNLLIKERTKKIQSRFYTVNFMWINRSLNTQQNFIVPATDEQDLQQNHLQGLLQWAQKTKKGTIVLWYDSAVTTSEAVEKTKKVIEKSESIVSRLFSRRAPIQLRDVRTLTCVQQSPEAFSDNLPVYFRADLLRVVATVETLEKERYPYFVYSDLDIQDTFTQEELFDPQTQEYLKKYGIVCNRKGEDHFENQFHIVHKGNKNLLEALRFAIIDLSIARVEYAIKDGAYDTPPKPIRRYYDHDFPQIVYRSYSQMFKYFYALEGYGILFNRDNKTPYNKERDGLEPFLNTSSLAFKVKNKNNPLRHRTSDFMKTEYGIVAWVPTKEVKFPPQKGNYT